MLEEAVALAVHERSLLFVLGELPYITSLHECARENFKDDEVLAIDGVKELLIEARDNYKAELKGRRGYHSASFVELP